MDANSKIYVAGHSGLVGTAIVKALKAAGCNNIIGRRSSELDLTRQAAVEEFFKQEKPEYVFLAAAKVGGIHANNQYPADFIYTNLVIESNVIHSAFEAKVKKLLFMGSGCIYPKMSPQPIKEEYLLSAPLELTNEAYAVAKIAGLKLCEYYSKQYGAGYISVMPANLYGNEDNFNLESSHVVPALIRKFSEAVEEGRDAVEVWGTGNAMREFMHVDDLADACLFLMDRYSAPEPINIGVGKDISIKELAEEIATIAGFTGKIIFNSAMPDGTPRKLLDSSKLQALGWQPKITLHDGLRSTYANYLHNKHLYRL